MSDRREFPEKIKVKRLNFAGFKCEGIVTKDDGSKVRCNAELTRTRVNYDHDDPDAMTGKPTFENCRALCVLCHKDKTKIDRKNIDRAKSLEAAHVGAKAKGAGFKKAEKERPEGRAPVPGMTAMQRRFVSNGR